MILKNIGKEGVNTRANGVKIYVAKGKTFECKDEEAKYLLREYSKHFAVEEEIKGGDKELQKLLKEKNAEIAEKDEIIEKQVAKIEELEALLKKEAEHAEEEKEAVEEEEKPVDEQEAFLNSVGKK